MGQLSDIIANMKTAIATKSTSRSGGGAFTDATAQYNIHPGADGSPWVHPGEARFYVHEDPFEGPVPLDRITGGRQWVSRRVLVYLGQETRDSEANEAGIMDTNVWRVVYAVETATGYPANSYPPLHRDVTELREEALFTTRIGFYVEYSEAYS